MKHNLQIKPRPSDYVMGVNSPIEFKAISKGVWPVWFNEDQRNPNFDDDGCACYGGNKSLDSQIDLLLPTLSTSTVSELSSMGFMETGIDGKLHFHSSPRFTEVLTGNGLNGNSMPEVFDCIRKFGAVPWSSLPFTSTTTEAEYFAPISQSVMNLGAQFLALMGGKNFLQYHWLENGGTKNVSVMQSAMLQAPLELGVAVDDAGWNQSIPVDPPSSQAVQHAVMAYSTMVPTISISDNYPPYDKVLDAGYPIHYVLQAVVSSLPPIVAVPAPTQPLVQAISGNLAPTEQNVSILQNLVALYTQLLSVFKKSMGFGSIPDDEKVATDNIFMTTTYSLLKSKTFWTLVFTFLSNGFLAISGNFNPTTVMAVNGILTIVASVFHLETGKSTTGSNS